MRLLSIARRLYSARPIAFKHIIGYQHPSLFAARPEIRRHFFVAFRQPSVRHCSTIPPKLPFFSSGNSTSYEIINFDKCVNTLREKYHIGVNEFVGIVQKASNFGSGDEAILFLDEYGVKPNQELVFLVIWELRDQWKLAYLVFKWGEKCKCLDENTWCLMIWILGNHSKFSTAWSLIRDLLQMSTDIQQAVLIMIDRYAAANNAGKAIHTFQILEKFSMSPDQRTLLTFLNILCKHGFIEEAEEFMLINKKLFPLEIDGFNIILNGWCNIVVDIFEAKRVWREMSKCCIEPNGTSYSHMISCFSKVRNLFDSLRLYDEMQKRGWVPGLEVYNALVYVLTCENCVKEALKIIDKVKHMGLRPDSSTYNLMICPLCESSKLDEARSILALMEEDNISPTIETYHAFLASASLEGTVEVLNTMRKAGVGPNGETFLLILDRFMKLKQPETALRIWLEMKQYEVVPESAHYSLLVGGLLECRLYSKARELYAEMKSNGFDDPGLRKFLEPAGPRGQGGVSNPEHTKNGKLVKHGTHKVIRNEKHRR
ncbi:pentatricopeptide repeat-containing protein At1g80880, mitochondrial [Solanum pennellii]|uniref:Pentatricopeptide repeat-containing protein At1g80880, mitochondrial n=1 Tax=Solanum pennellii TaxID=28526 RepID=A0ABM1GFY2_SOLPN|nr:pentatricopeptide repeat-containing protein At1g80880, mitochondrial [Solanum pennellii]